MLFEIVKDVPFRSGVLLYREKEYSIDFIPNQGGDYTLLLAYLNIDFDMSTGCACQVWGLHSHRLWIKKELQTPKNQKGSIRPISITLDQGDTSRLEGSFEWKSYYDTENKWLCIGECNLEENDRVVEFATNTIAVLNQGQLKSLWLNPSIMCSTMCMID